MSDSDRRDILFFKKMRLVKRFADLERKVQGQQIEISKAMHMFESLGANTEKSDFILTKDEIKEIEKALQNEPSPVVFTDIFIIPDDEKKTISICTAGKEIIELNRNKAEVLMKIIGQCIQK